MKEDDADGGSTSAARFGGCRPRPFLAHVLSHPVANFAPESLEIGRPGPGSICTDCQPRRPPWGEFSSPVTDK